MYRYLFILLTLSIANIHFAWSQSTINRDLSAFSGLYVDDHINVRLIKSDKEHAEIKIKGVAADDLKTEVVDGTLRIYVYGNLFTKKDILVNLNYKELHSIEAINGSDITTTSLLKTDSLLVTLKTGAVLYLDADVEFLKSHVIEGSLLNAKGYATVQDIYVSTSGTVSAYELESDVVQVKATMNGNAKIYVEKELNAYVGSGGDISYNGNPKILNSETLSGGTVTSHEQD